MSSQVSHATVVQLGWRFSATRGSSLAISGPEVAGALAVISALCSRFRSDNSVSEFYQ